MHARSRGVLFAGFSLAVVAAASVRAWNALTGPLMWGYDAPGHVSYVFYLDAYRAIPWAHQGWGYFHPPLHYVAGWALAQLGSADVLLRGLALLGSAASLAIAALAAAVTRAASPERRGLPLLAFTAVAFLPVHLYASAMEGNELTAAAFGAGALASLVANERRGRPTLAGDLRTGLLVGLALLTKFSGAVSLAVALAVVALRALADGDLRRGFARGGALAGAALVLAGPYYARNVAEYGTPFRMNRDYRLTARVEEAQAPGSRSWLDFVQVSPRLFADPRPGAPHLLHSVWGTAYVNTWVDARALWNRLPEADAARLARLRVALLALGLAPALLALAGAGLALRDAARGRRRGVYVPLLVTSAASLAAFALFAIRVPVASALKASYLLGLSLPYGAFLARSVEALRGRPALAAGAAAIVVAGAALAAATHTSGLLLPRREDGPALGAVHHLVGRPQKARRFYRERLEAAPDSLRWLEPLAAVELASGNAAEARQLYARALARSPGNPLRLNRLGVAEALAGDLAAARALFDRAVERGGGAPPLANRGAVRAASGDLPGARRDLERAVELEPELASAWDALAQVLAREGRDAEAATARARAARAATTPPHGYPYRVGAGLLHLDPRPLLHLRRGAVLEK